MKKTHHTKKAYLLSIFVLVILSQTISQSAGKITSFKGKVVEVGNNKVLEITPNGIDASQKDPKEELFEIYGLHFEYKYKGDQKEKLMDITYDIKKNGMWSYYLGNSEYVSDVKWETFDISEWRAAKSGTVKYYFLVEEGNEGDDICTTDKSYEILKLPGAVKPDLRTKIINTKKKQLEAKTNKRYRIESVVGHSGGYVGIIKHSHKNGCGSVSNKYVFVSKSTKESIDAAAENEEFINSNKITNSEIINIIHLEKPNDPEFWQSTFGELEQWIESDINKYELEKIKRTTVAGPRG